MRGVIRLFPDYTLARADHGKRHTSDITLGIGRIVNKYDKLVLLSSLDVIGDVEPESKVTPSMESSFLTLLISLLSNAYPRIRTLIKTVAS